MNYILKLWMPSAYVFQSYVFEKENINFFPVEISISEKNCLIRENERVLRILVLFIWFTIESQNLSVHQKTRKMKENYSLSICCFSGLRQSRIEYQIVCHHK